MPELILEIGGRVFEVACEPARSPRSSAPARCSTPEAARIGEAGRATESGCCCSPG